MLLKYLINPKLKGFKKFGIILQPGGMEIEAQRGTVLLVVPIFQF
jgi:hypothetical protein